MNYFWQTYLFFQIQKNVISFLHSVYYLPQELKYVFGSRYNKYTCYLPFPIIWGSIKGVVTWTRQVLFSNPVELFWESSKRDEEESVEKECDLAWLIAHISESRPTQATTGHGFGLYSWACLRVPVFQHLCRTCVLMHFKYFKPTYVFIQLQSKFSYSFFINKEFSSFTSPSIHPLLQTIIYSTVKFIH